jgi:ATP-dependent Clp protease ATP-binding subunit ClpC
MFERYLEPARRAIFFARYVALMNEAAAIDSGHLLCGLIWEETYRAVVLFGLREIFPLYRECPHKVANYSLVKSLNIPLTAAGKRILAKAAGKADAMQDYWIDTEHLLLGIVAEQACPAAQHLAKARIHLQNAREVIKNNHASRPKYPDYYDPEVKPGETPSLLDRMISQWRKWKFGR